MFQYRLIIKYSVIWVSVYWKYYEWNDGKGALFLFQWLHRDVILYLNIAWVHSSCSVTFFFYLLYTNIWSLYIYAFMILWFFIYDILFFLTFTYPWHDNNKIKNTYMWFTFLKVLYRYFYFEYYFQMKKNWSDNE